MRDRSTLEARPRVVRVAPALRNRRESQCLRNFNPGWRRSEGQRVLATHDRGKQWQLWRLERNKKYGSLSDGEYAKHVR